MTHETTIAERTDELPHYSRNNWSVEMICPVCKRTGWFNKNFLGRRHVMCDGVKFDKVKITFEDA